MTTHRTTLDRISTPEPSAKTERATPDGCASSSEATGSACLEIAKPYPIPAQVAVCPECGGKLEFQLTTDEPDFDGIVIDCENDPGCEHRYWQSDWMPVVDAVKLHAWRMLLSSQNTQAEPRGN